MSIPLKRKETKEVFLIIGPLVEERQVTGVERGQVVWKKEVSCLALLFWLASTLSRLANHQATAGTKWPLPHFHAPRGGRAFRPAELESCSRESEGDGVQWVLNPSSFVLACCPPPAPARGSPLLAAVAASGLNDTRVPLLRGRVHEYSTHASKGIQKCLSGSQEKNLSLTMCCACAASPLVNEHEHARLLLPSAHPPPNSHAAAMMMLRQERETQMGGIDSVMMPLANQWSLTIVSCASVQTRQVAAARPCRASNTAASSHVPLDLLGV